MSIRRKSMVSALSAMASLAIVASSHAALVDSFDPPTAGATFSQFGSAPGPVVTAGGPTGNFLRLTNDAVNSQNNAIAYSRSDVGAYSRVVGSFDFRAGGSGDNADGFSYILLPTATNGISGAGINPGVAEEPNIANTFAAGFDLYPPATTNDVSVHFNGAEHRNVNVPTGTITLDNQVFHRATVTLQHVTGGAYASIELTNDINGAASPKTTQISHFIPGLLPYENRVQFSGRTGGADMNIDLDNVAVNYSNPVLASNTVQNFEGGVQTPMHFVQNGTGPAAFTLSGGPSGSFLRLLNDVGSQNNVVLFAATDHGVGAKDKIIADFDFRITNGPGAGMADGFAMMLLPTATYGLHGGNGINLNHEEPNAAGVIALGFDLYPGENDASLHFGSELQNIDLNPALIDLDSGQFHHAHLELVEQGGQVLATLILTPNAGAPITAFANVVIPGLTELYDYRVQFGGRTGGETMFLDLDNISVGAAAVPEPASLMLGILGMGALALRRRRAA